MLGDGGGSHQRAYDNQVVSTTNYAVAIAGGQDNEFYRNRAVSSGRLPDGRFIAAQNVGMYIWNQYDAPFEGAKGYDNQCGWVRSPEGDRNDYWIKDRDGQSDAAFWENNVSLEGPITLETEQAEWTRWQQKLSEAGVTVGTGNPRPTMVVRARGATGEEQIEVRYNDQVVGQPITLSTSFEEYSVAGAEGSGNLKVAFINDDGERDVWVDWLERGDERRQAEDQPINTGAWADGQCGGGTLTEALHCNGYIDFGTIGGEVASGKILIRAKSSQGDERMDLAVNGQIVKSWSVTNDPNNYLYEGYSGGEIKIVFNDDGGSREDGTDRNLGINYIDVCGTRYENNAEGVVRDGCGTDNERGFAWLWCDGSLSFGDVGCNSNARTTTPDTKISFPKKLEESFRTYPNPATEQLTVEGNEDYQVIMYDMSGRVVLTRNHAKGKTRLNVGSLQSGLYLIELRHDQHSVKQRIVIE